MNLLFDENKIFMLGHIWYDDDHDEPLQII